MNGGSIAAGAWLGQDLGGIDALSAVPVGTARLADASNAGQLPAAGTAPDAGHRPDSLRRIALPSVGGIDQTASTRPSSAEPGAMPTRVGHGEFASPAASDPRPGALALAHLNLPGLATSLAPPSEGAAASRPLPKSVPEARSAMASLLKAAQTFSDDAQAELKDFLAPGPVLKNSGNMMNDQAEFYSELLDSQRVMLKLQVHLSWAEMLQSVPKKLSDTVLNMQS